MIDEKTSNKNYPLPNPENRASDDVERIAAALTMIDADLSACDEKISESSGLAQKLEGDALRIPSELVGKIETEVKDIAAKKYIVVNASGTGFTTVEGGGGAGGKKGEVLIKKSDENFDTTWVDPRAILKKSATVENVTDDNTLRSNSFSILADEVEIGSDDIPQQGITPHQVANSSTLDSFHGYILTDEIENEDEGLDLASKTNFGRVKVGDGFDVNNGVISVPKIPTATQETPGIIQIGEGFEVSKGVITVPEAKIAGHNNYGVVKLSADFEIGANGELLLTKKTSGDTPIVYQTRKKSLVKDSIIKIQPDCAYYLVFVDKDTAFKIEIDFEQADDIAFDIELISDGTHIISFGDKVVWDIPCTAITEGTSLIHFEKDVCNEIIRGNLIQMPKPQDVRLLTATSNDDIQPNFIAHHNGSGWNAYRFFRSSDYSNYMSFYTPNEVVFQMDFMRSTCIDYIEIYNGFGGKNFKYFYVEASIDGHNWVKLFEDHENTPQNVILDKYGFFKHYRTRTSNNILLNMIRWYGTYVDDDLYELEKIMPVMASESENGFEITSSEISSGNLQNLLTADVFSDIKLAVQSAGAAWIQYKLPEAQNVNLLDLGFSNSTMPKWFKFEGSLDGENWDLLLERKQLEDFCTGETRQYWLAGENAYLYYKLTSVDATTSGWNLGRFRLYKKQEGLSGAKLVPSMLNNSQYGYVLSCSSAFNGDHEAFKAFDGNTGTQWASSTNSHIGAWLCVKFPEETVCSHVYLKARNDQYYPQAASSFEIQGSIDGTNFETLKTVTDTSWEQGEEKLIEFFNEKAFLYYRIYATAIQDGNSCAFSEVNFGNDSRILKRELFHERKLTPKMTADAQDGFIVTASSIYKGAKVYNPFEAFNEEVSDGSSWTGKGNSAWIRIELPEADKATAVRLSGGYSKEEPETFTLYGSNDGENYTVLLEVSGLNWSHNETKIWSFENDIAYKYYKISATNTRADYITISEIQLLEVTQIKEY